MADQEQNPAATNEAVVDPNAGPGVERVQFPATGVTGSEAPKKPEATPAGDRPEGLPEGFDSWEAFGKAQLEAKGKDAGQEEGAGAEAPGVEEALAGLPEESREKAKPFFEEFATSGTLSDGSKKAAAEAFGVSVEMVEMYMAGAQATEANAGAQLLTAAGVSQEDYSGYAAWAADNLTVDQKKAFNEGLEKDPSKTLSDAISAWKESGSAPGPRDITRNESAGQKGSDKGVTGYASVAEMTRDMGNPLYQKDPAFRAQVEKKVAASDFSLGKDVGNQ